MYIIYILLYVLHVYINLEVDLQIMAKVRNVFHQHKNTEEVAPIKVISFRSQRYFIFYNRGIDMSKDYKDYYISTPFFFILLNYYREETEKIFT